MTQYKDAVKKQDKKLKAEEDNSRVVWYEYQRGADQHFRKLKYASGKEVTIDLSNKN